MALGLQVPMALGGKAAKKIKVSANFQVDG